MEIEPTAQEIEDLRQYELARQAARKILQGVAELENMRVRWNALASGDNMIPGEGSYNGLTRADIAACFTSADALRVVLDAGSATNLSKVA